MVRLPVLQRSTRLFATGAICLSRATSSRRTRDWRLEEAHRVDVTLNELNRPRVPIYRMNRVVVIWCHLLKLSPTRHSLERPSHNQTLKPVFGGTDHGLRPTATLPQKHKNETQKFVDFRGHYFGIFFFVCAPLCVCVCVFSSHSFWTSMDVPAGVTQEEGNTGFSIHLLSAVLALIFLARRIQPFLSLVDREVKFCVLTI